MQPTPTLLICATKPEWSFLKKHFEVNQVSKFPPVYQLADHIHLMQIGIGMEATEKNLELLPETLLQNTQILHFGYSGALVPSLKTGDLIVPSENFISEHLKVNKVSFISGPFHSSAVILKNKSEKETIHQTTKAIAVDMEYETVKAWALSNKLPYHTLRVIFDELDEDISFLAENPMVNNSGNVEAGMALKAFAKHPKSILSIPHIQKMASLANKSLEKALMAILK